MRAAWVLMIATFAAAACAPAARAQYAGQHYGENVVRCESDDNRSRFCPADTRGGVRLARQLSDTPCVEGRSWGVRRDGVWVDDGCRAEFVIGYGGSPGWGGSDVVRCESRNNRWTHCPVSARGGVRLLRQLSASPCIEGQTWGQDRRGVWVAGGCRAEFRVRRGWQEPARLVRCESGDNRSRFCPVDIRGGVRLVRQFSRSPCIEGRSWGVQRGGIWVDHGCRGEFEVGRRGGWGWRDDHPRPWGAPEEESGPWVEEDR